MDWKHESLFFFSYSCKTEVEKLAINFDFMSTLKQKIIMKTQKRFLCLTGLIQIQILSTAYLTFPIILQ